MSPPDVRMRAARVALALENVAADPPARSPVLCREVLILEQARALRQAPLVGILAHLVENHFQPELEHCVLLLVVRRDFIERRVDCRQRVEGAANVVVY